MLRFWSGAYNAFQVLLSSPGKEVSFFSFFAWLCMMVGHLCGDIMVEWLEKLLQWSPLWAHICSSMIVLLLSGRKLLPPLETGLVPCLDLVTYNYVIEVTVFRFWTCPLCLLLEPCHYPMSKPRLACWRMRRPTNRAKSSQLSLLRPCEVTLSLPIHQMSQTHEHTQLLSQAQITNLPRRLIAIRIGYGLRQ
jgi:hypothetical protein